MLVLYFCCSYVCARNLKTTNFMKNLVNELFENSNRPTQGDNRSYYVKCLNKILNDGFIKIEINENGKIWTNPNVVNSDGSLRKFNIIIKGYGWTKRAYQRDFDAKDLLKEVGGFIQYPEVQAKHVSSIQLSGLETCECERCNGKGFIEAFNYYCSGICFECYGSKYSVRKFNLSV